MAGKRRSLIRELHDLIPVLETEYNGQVKIPSLEDTSVNVVVVEITPSKGYYAHASFAFSVEVTPGYPYEHPMVTCLTSVFHPNIQSDSNRNNVCLNFLNYWESCFGIKDLFHALLFLFYEPNFDDPLNPVAYAEEGLSIEETVHKSLRGGLINSKMYEPNEAWLNWIEKNNSQAGDSGRAVDSNLCGTPSSPLRQQSTLSNYFRPALSGQYSPITHSIWDWWPTNYDTEFYTNYVFTRQITIISSSHGASVQDLLHETRRYFFIEQCSYSRSSIISDLDEASTRTSLITNYGQMYRSGQLANCGPWIITPNNASIYHEEAFSPGNLVSQETDDERCVSDASDTEEFDENGVIMRYSAVDTVAPETLETQDEEAPNIIEDCREIVPFETDGQADGAFIEQASQEDAAHQVSESVGIAQNTNTDASVEDHDETTNVAGDGEWDEVDVGHNAQATSDVQSEFSAYIEDSHYLSIELEEQNRLAQQLAPWWWIMYRSRWPVHLAPRHCSRTKYFKPKLNFARSSTGVLWTDLFQTGMKYNEPTLILLVDSLSLSPLSPMLNRAVTFRGRNGRSVYWCGLDWYSLWDAIQPRTCGTLSPRIHFRLPSVMFTLCYMHNWLAYLSRMELYGSCLGYSRPLRPGVLSNAATTCITPASLGCGQCSVLDMWPLWLMWRVTRKLCKLAVFLCARSFYIDERSGPMRTVVSFPFSDLNEI